MPEITWDIPEPTTRLAALSVAETYGLGHPLVAQVLLNRGLVGADLDLYLSPDMGRLHKPDGLARMDGALKIMDEALRSGRRIVVYGDYDVDGTTGATLLASYLRAKGGDVSTFIPLRSEGYGLSDESITRIATERKPELILTVDCGTSSRKEVELARSLGMEVVVTDHHRPTPGKQTMGIVVNPQLDGDTYENKGLAGVGVAYKLIAGLYGSQPAFNLDLVALGTIADIMPLTGENRILVREGLFQLGHTRRPGLAALIAVSGVKAITCPHGAKWCMTCGLAREAHVDPSHGVECYPVRAEDVAFRIGPRINAVGRMGLDPQLVVDLMMADAKDPEAVSAAKASVALIDETNVARQTMTRALVDEAMPRVDLADPVIVMDFNQEISIKGVAGLVAGQLTQEFARPTIVIDGSGSGSARSIEGVPLLTILQSGYSQFVTAQGHEAAMGISNVTDTEALRAALRAHPWPPGIGLRELKIDAVCDLGDLNSRLLDSLRLLEPTGKGNPTPLFALSGVRVDEAKIDQKSGRHVFLRLTDVQTGRTIRAPWFFRADQAPAPGSIVDVAGRPTLNDFAGRTSIEFMVVAVRPTEAVMPRTIRDAA